MDKLNKNLEYLNLIVYITGGASGLGESAARYLYSKGHKISIADKNEKRLESLRKEFSGDRFIAIKCDVTNENDVKNSIEETVKAWGTIHVALACAGVVLPTMLLTSKKTLDMKVFKNVIDINLYGTIYVAKYAAIQIAKNQQINDKGDRGVIIMISSVAANEGMRGQAAYSASKGAINGMVMPMARDLGKYGIRVVAIAPGIFMTPIADYIPKQVQEKLMKDTPMGRPGNVNEFSKFVETVIQNTYLNGVHLRIDGAIKLSNM